MPHTVGHLAHFFEKLNINIIMMMLIHWLITHGLFIANTY
jgi:hypothetical protein